jgi:XTP/dITP diphosphohydrolase
MNSREEQKKSFERLLDVMDRLRIECPWDKKQTIESIRNLTIEEVYELSEAILNNDTENIKEELGDVLLHIVFYAKIQSEKDLFDIKDVCDYLCDKLIYRHPHVFGDTKVNGEEDVMTNWELLKLKEKHKKEKKTILGGVPKELPALIKAHRIQDKARNAGFDWEEPAQVWDKVAEEIDEVKAEIKVNDKDRIESEFGDLLFAVINAARLYGVDPENALQRTNQRFIKRFNYLEEKTISEGKILKEMSLEQMEEIWKEAKSLV